MEAINAANGVGPSDVCTPGSSGANIIDAPGTFVLTAIDNNMPVLFGGPNGLPVITSAITIRNATITRASGSPHFRILQVAAGGNLTLNSVTIGGGRTTCSAVSCNGGFALGGGILTSGTLTLTNSKVRDNTASCSLSSTCAARGGGINKIGGTLTTTGVSWPTTSPPALPPAATPPPAGESSPTAARSR